ncbi:hypothetical protein KR018_008043 [Drosophila ironensis]|nr:hypothetical protein KR018_008043 [Drosophila ironensis]
MTIKSSRKIRKIPISVKKSRSKETPISQNGFLNYMREFRRHNSHLRLSDCAIQGGREWRRLSNEQQSFYRCQDSDSQLNDCEECKKSEVSVASNTTVASEESMTSNSDGLCTRRKSSCKRKKRACRPKKRSCKRKKRSCRRKKRSCRRKKRPCRRKKPKCRPKRCSELGPVMNGAYIHFIRAYRDEHCGLGPHELICKAAKAWSRLSEEMKNLYRRMVG